MLSSSVLLAYIVAVGVVWYAVLWWTKWRKMPPGPYGVPLLGYLPFMVWGKRPINHNLFKKLHDKYGPIWSLSASQFCDVISIADSEIVEELYKKEELAIRPRTRTFELISGKGGHVHGIGKVWYENRKFAVRIFREYLFKDTQKLNNLVMDTVMEVIESLNQNLNHPVELDTAINLGLVNLLWTVLAQRTLFKSFGTFVINKALTAVTLVNDLAMHDFLPRCIAEWSPFYRKTIAILKESIDWGNKMTLEDIRVHREERITDFYIGQYLQEIECCKDECFSQEELVRNIRSLLAVAVDTSASTLKWAIKYLIDYPEIQRRCQQEVDRVIGQERLPHINDLPHLPYLTAFIEENYRMSAVVQTIPRQASADVFCRGYLIPKGAWCLGQTYVCQRNEAIFPEPDQFKPERFLDENSCFVKAKRGMMSFGKGNRRCYGERLAGIELGLILATFLQKYDFLPPPSKTAGSQNEYPTGRIFEYLNQAPPFQVVIRQRHLSHSKET